MSMRGVHFMEQITITAKVQIVATDTDKVLLNETMSVYCDACNYVSDYVFRTHDLKQFSLNKILYSTLREKFSLVVVVCGIWLQELYVLSDCIFVCYDDNIYYP